MHLSLSYPHPHSCVRPWERGTDFVPRQTMSISSGWQGGGKGLFDNGAPKGINMAPLFIDPRLDKPTTACSIPFRLWITSVYSCSVLGFSAFLIFAALCLSHTLPFGRWWVLTGTVKCNVCGGNMMAVKLLFCLPQAQLCLLALSLMSELERTA